MKKFGLIGHPIAHSLSPALFDAAFNGKYSYDLIEEKDFEKAYERFLEEYDAINVTAPFKEKAFLMADSSDNDCQAIGAANILHKDDTDGLVSAYNSDVDGVTGALAPYRKTGIKTLSASRQTTETPKLSADVRNTKSAALRTTEKEKKLAAEKTKHSKKNMTLKT